MSETIRDHAATLRRIDQRAQKATLAGRSRKPEICYPCVVGDKVMFGANAKPVSIEEADIMIARQMVKP